MIDVIQLHLMHEGGIIFGIYLRYATSEKNPGSDTGFILKSPGDLAFLLISGKHTPQLKTYHLKLTTFL